MLKLTLLEFFLRGLPEGFLIIFAVYVFSKTVINIKRYIVSSIIYRYCSLFNKIITNSIWGTYYS